MTTRSASDQQGTNAQDADPDAQPGASMSTTSVNTYGLHLSASSGILFANAVTRARMEDTRARALGSNDLARLLQPARARARNRP